MTVHDDAGRAAPTQGDAVGAAPRREAAPTQGDDLARATATRSDELRAVGPLLGGIPASVLNGYEPIRALPSGAQAHLVVCRDRATGREVVVKYYVGGTATQYAALRAVYDELREGRSEHLVVPDLHWAGGRLWEVQEYFGAGTLQQLVTPTGIARKQVRTVLAELVDALHDAHSRRVVHRDVKPDNVFVRTLAPLSLVLGDFGAAALLELDDEVRSSVGSWFYIAPEMYAGKVDVEGKADYWSLGIVVHELLTGRHVLSDVDGRRASDREVRYAVLNRSVPVDYPEARWAMLLEGLLTYDPDTRWAEPEVRTWLAGGSPRVNRLGARAGRPDQPGAGFALAELPFTLADTVHRDPRALAATLRQSWRSAAEELVEPRKRAELGAWLERAGVDPKILAAPYDDPAVLPLALQLLLDPAATPEYRGRALAQDSLTDVARKAVGGDPAAAAWIRDLRTGEALTVWASAQQEPDQVLRAQNRLSSWWTAIDKQAELARRERAVTDRVEGDALAAALSEGHRAARLRAGTSALDLSPLPADAEAVRSATAPLVAGGNAVAAAFADLLLRAAHESETTRLAAMAQAERAAARERAREVRAAERAPRLAAARRSLRRHAWALAAYSVLLVVYRLSARGDGSSSSWVPAVAAVGLFAGGIAAIYVWDRHEAPRLFAHGTVLFLAVFASADELVARWGLRDVRYALIPVFVLGAMVLSRLLGRLFAVPPRGQGPERAPAGAASRPARLILRCGLVAFVPSALLAATWVTMGLAERFSGLGANLLDGAPDPWVAARWLEETLPDGNSAWIAHHAGAVWLSVPVVAIAWLVVWNGIGRASRTNVATGAAAIVVAAAVLSVWFALPLAAYPWLAFGYGLAAIPLAIVVPWVAKSRGDTR